MYLSESALFAICVGLWFFFTPQGEKKDFGDSIFEVVKGIVVLIFLPVLLPYWGLKYWLCGEEISNYDQNEIEWLERNKGHDPEVDQWADAKIAEIKSKYRLISK